MFNSKKNWILVSLLFCSSQAIASITSFGTITVDGNTYDNISNNGIPSSPGSNFNQFQVNAGNGITINVSGWSDTKNANSADYLIERAADFDRNGNGWSIENKDENPDQYCGYSHSADNFSCNSEAYTDYDFFVLDFGSTEVHLTEVYSSWLANSGNEQEVSVAALDSSQSSDLTDNTFANILANDQGSNSFSFTGSGGQAGQNIASYYSDVAGVTDNQGESAFSSVWIVSAYNEMFGTASGGTANNDGFKLAAINFVTRSPEDPNTDIPEPAPLALMLIALIGLARNKSLKK